MLYGARPGWLHFGVLQMGWPRRMSEQGPKQVSAGPKLQHAIRSKAGVAAFWGASDGVAKVDGFAGPETARSFEYSKDGNMFALVNLDNVQIFNAQTWQLLSTIPRPNVLAIAFSPMNTFIVTWERMEEKTNNNENNLIVWRIETAEPIAKYTQKVFSTDNWPSLSWTKDEVYYARAVKNEVHFFAARSARPQEVVRKLQLANVAHLEFSPAPNAPYHLAVFVPERKSEAGSVRIYAVSHAQGETIRATASKSFFRGTYAKLMWNSTGTALLASLSTDVDATGRSYYGETGLYFLTTDASFQCLIQLQKEGPIHDVSWSPTGKEFVVTYGFMPSPQTTLFDVKCSPVIDFGVASRNTLRWSPNGKLLCIGGFGNLTGQMDFWDVKNTKLVGSAIAHCAAVCEWAPDSRHFIAAVVSPRIRVDNGYKIFRYDGLMVYEAAVNELYHVAWRPRPVASYPDRPLSPPKAGAAGVAAPAAAAPKPAAAAPAKYRHPHAKDTSTYVAPSLEEGVKRYKPQAEKKVEKSLPPGWFEEDEDKQKKKKKKNKKKKNADGAAPTEGAASPDQEVSQGLENLSVSSPPLSPPTTTTTTSATTSTAPTSPAPESAVPSKVSSPQPRAAQSPKGQQPPRNKAPNKK
eukprot:Phypoly_transcript_02269.p1 GENE.Phypoly_transcript_02269~~Phypoly_transcript_02269.p1  ORF type:complete len:634 (+),score=118.93 Phypoly_transcript_02269:977-2878(+)